MAQSPTTLGWPFPIWKPGEAGLVDVSQVDSAQGGEADLVIIATTRAESLRAWAVMGDRRWLDVARGGARAGVVIAGNAAV
eukprot:245833-Pyramimonas_sp.AAC.1